MKAKRILFTAQQDAAGWNEASQNTVTMNLLIGLSFSRYRDSSFS
jgi:hypothetical protein